MAFDFAGFQTQINKALDHLRSELGSLRTGRASVQLLDPVLVEAYGTKMKVSELANISVPESNLILISPWDKSLLAAIEKGIQISNLGLNPVVDKDIIRIVIPALTEERRQEMVKALHQRAEAGRAMLRTVRGDTRKDIEKTKGQEDVSEDDIAQDLQTLDKKIQEVMSLVDQLVADKEKELMKI